MPISAATMQGVRELPGLVYNRLKDIPAIPVFAPEYKKPEPKAERPRLYHQADGSPRLER